MTSPKFSTKLIDAIGLGSDSRFDLTSLHRILAVIEARLSPLEGQKDEIDIQIEQLRLVGLKRINEALAPALAWIAEVQGMGFLIAKSSTSANLVNGNIITFIVDDQAERAMFTPSPFTALTRTATADDYAIARTIAFDQESGAYICEVLVAVGASGPHAEWVIGALAGATAASYLLSEQVIADRVVVGQDRAAVSQLKQDMLDEKQAVISIVNAAIEQLNTIHQATTTARDTSVSASSRANEWAEAPEGQEVLPGQYSAKHHAEKSAQSAAAAALFDPSSYYTKSQTYTQAEIAAGIGSAIDGLVGSALGGDADFAASTATKFGLKAEKSTEIATGTGLSGGGDLTADLTVSIDKATPSNWRSRTADKVLTADGLTDALTKVTLTDAASVAVNWQAGFIYRLTMGGNRTLTNPTNVVAGSTIIIEIYGNSTTARSLSFGSNYRPAIPSETLTSTNGLILSLYAESATRIIPTWKVAE